MASLTPFHLATGDEYIAARNRRVAENQRVFEELGIGHYQTQLNDLLHKEAKPKSKATRSKTPPPIPRRQSSRLIMRSANESHEEPQVDEDETVIELDLKPSTISLEDVIRQALETVDYPEASLLPASLEKAMIELKENYFTVDSLCRGTLPAAQWWSDKGFKGAEVTALTAAIDRAVANKFQGIYVHAMMQMFSSITFTVGTLIV